MVSRDCGGTHHAVQRCMRRVLVAAIVLVPSLAAANPITAGVSLGLSQAKEDAQADASQTVGLYGRLGFSSRLSGQLEVARYQTEDGSNVDIRTATALLVVDLSHSRHWVPTLSAGIGLDDESSEFQSTSGHHIEGGFGLEYRADGGLTLGVDARMGGRSIDEGGQKPQPVEGDIVFFAPSHMSEGEYRSVRVTLGIRF